MKTCKQCNRNELVINKFYGKLCNECYKIYTKEKNLKRLQKLKDVTPPQNKICKKCKINKSKEEFEIAVLSSDKLDNLCRVCNKERKCYRDKLWRANNDEKVRKKLHNYHLKHKYDLNRRYSGYKCRAKSNKMEFNLSKEQFSLITQKKCLYCDKFSLNMNFVGIDRIDSNIGYIENNIVPCCDICNLMKSDLNILEFLKKIGEINARNTEITEDERIRRNLYSIGN